MILDELVIQYSGRVDDASMVRLGKLSGADTLLTYRIEAFHNDVSLERVAWKGGDVIGSVEFRLINVESGLTLFRQAVTATATLTNPGRGKIWSLQSVQDAYRGAVEQASAFAMASLMAAFGDNPLGIVPDLTAAGGGFLVLDVLQGSPAQMAALNSGDRIVAINGSPLTSWTLPIALPSTLTIERAGARHDLAVRP